MLDTKLEHILSEEDFNQVISENENTMICCGRMGQMCIPVFGAMARLEKDYPNVVFRDLFFDAPHSHLIRNLPECKNFRGLPFTVYFKNGKVAAATTSIQTEEEIKEILDREFK
jgi:thioredoxin 1